MLTFRTTNLFFAVLIAATILLNFRFRMPVMVYVVLVIVYVGILFYGSYFIRAGFYFKSICSAETGKKEIAISFDDGPAKHFTPDILQVLKANHTEAAFFCIGERIGGNEQLLQQILAEGHIIGNHSYSHHFWFDLFSSRKMLNDMQLMGEATRQITGLVPRLFRPPYGVTNPNLRRAIKSGGYISVGWSVRSFDTVIKKQDKLLKKINSALKPGAIFLFHDTSRTTLDILPGFINHVHAEGYQITRLDKMLSLNAYA